MISMNFVSIYMIGISLFATCWANNLDIKYQWKTIDFNYTSVEKRQEAIDKQTFIPNNVIPVGLEVYKDRLFLSLPRLKRGVPVSLAYINMTEEAEKRRKICIVKFIFIRIHGNLIKLVLDQSFIICLAFYWRRTLIEIQLINIIFETVQDYCEKRNFMWI